MTSIAVPALVVPGLRPRVAALDLDGPAIATSAAFSVASAMAVFDLGTVLGVSRAFYPGGEDGVGAWLPIAPRLWFVAVMAASFGLGAHLVVGMRRRAWDETGALVAARNAAHRRVVWGVGVVAAVGLIALGTVGLLTAQASPAAPPPAPAERSTAPPPPAAAAFAEQPATVVASLGAMTRAAAPGGTDPVIATHTPPGARAAPPDATDAGAQPNRWLLAYIVAISGEGPPTDLPADRAAPRLGGDAARRTGVVFALISALALLLSVLAGRFGPRPDDPFARAPTPSAPMVRPGM